MQNLMWNFYLYRHIPKKLREVLNGFVPGLIKEPIPVRVRSGR